MIFGRNLRGGGSRIGMLGLIGIGWVLGDRFGIPEPIRNMVYDNLASMGEMFSRFFS